ncbi:glyoxylate/hydroxypyruvate reductase HPR3-like [Benincasa hispida]|uniref:glyoxylate/hydroxypyruvate reductase HPR3-like n=1 Tax=Benincasa hispida TaxID=102211 RepID=UPI0018FFBFDC|nr:glyoxylate/hydroxypyruvate reductase HPR3-like [Benincasa hispida]
MATEDQAKDELPQVLVLGPPLIFPYLESQFTNRFHFLKPWLSNLSLTQFLTSYTQSTQALLIRGGGTAQLTTAILDCLPSLKLVVTSSVGVDHLYLPELHRRGVAIAHARNVFSEDAADMAVGLLIDVLRKVSAGDRFVRQGLWLTKGHFPSGLKLSGKRIGIVGLGKIGSEVAKRLEGFGCKISYNSRIKKSKAPYSYYSNVYELAANCEVLIICCALTEETYHIINKEVMVALGKDGVIVNIGRGAIIDEKEMIRRLIQGEIGGAGLDVFENEPVIAEEFLNLDNVVLSPHAAAMTYESSMEVCRLVVDNLEAFFSNKPLVSPFVD